MFAGHYSAAFVAKSAQPRVPLWTLLLAAQAVDVLWTSFVLAGVEHLRLDFSLASNPLVLYDMPFTHSLLGSLVWAGLSFVFVRWWFASTLGALAIAATVVSHWFLDLLVHRPDLTLWGESSAKLGLGLWNYPVTALVLEFALLAASVWVYVRAGVAAHMRRRLFIMLGLLTTLQLAMTLAPPPRGVGTSQLALSTLSVLLAVAGAGVLIERPARA
jgi:hypothetical protein